MEPEQVLERLAGTLRREIGPAVGESYPRTQAFMASVILEKLSRQLRLAAEHAEADRRDCRELLDELRAMAGPTPPDQLAAALDDAASAAGNNGRSGPGTANDSATNIALSRIVDVLYAGREQLGRDLFEALLARVRRTLRARLDRQLAYAA
jgi:hypothetical protein